MRRGAQAVLVGVLVAVTPAAAVAAPTGVPANRALVPANAAFARAAIPCTATTARFRVWWDERKGSPDAPPGVDGRCRTLPPLVARLLADVERVRVAELALGFTDAPDDRALSRNGGDARHDVYVHHSSGRGETGSEWCSYLSRGSTILRTSSYTIVSPGAGAGIDLDETVAHEYFHAIQCRYVPRITRLPPWIAEGTANWMAALVTPGVFAPSPTRIGNLMGRLASSASSTLPLTGQGYDAWGFWYSATGGAARPGIVRQILQRVGSGTGALAATRLAIPALAEALRTYATEVGRGTMIGGTTLPLAFPNWFADPPSVVIGPDAPTDALTLEPLGYGYRAVSWTGGSVGGNLTLVGAGPLATSCALVGADGTPLAPTVVGGDLLFALPTSDGTALLVVTNPSAVAVRVGVTTRVATVG